MYIVLECVVFFFSGMYCIALYVLEPSWPVGTYNLISEYTHNKETKVIPNI